MEPLLPKRRYDEMSRSQPRVSSTCLLEQYLPTSPPAGSERISNIDLLEREVCYGALLDAAAKVQGKPKPVRAPDSDTNFQHFCVRAKDAVYLLCFENGVEFAVLDTQTTSRLKALRDMPDVRFEAVVSSGTLAKRQKGGKKNPQILSVSVNIFGLKSTADSAASCLWKASAGLQHPQALKEAIDYYNPQFLSFPGDDQDMGKFIGAANVSTGLSDIKVKEEMQKILESLTEVEGVELELPTGLISRLKSHQHDGVRFILQREDKESTQLFSGRIQHLIATKTKELPALSFGGLIADVMGLGKTLTMLAAVFHSMHAAEDFSRFYEVSEDEQTGKLRTKATLVVVSSAQLLDTWVSEIECHFVPGALSFVCFHGQDRPRESTVLREFDLVLTTYDTLAADYAGQSILHDMEWYRVALDEAHWIRNPTSKKFRAATCLHSRRRWCLTGTPIQNKLQDLTSLVRFLKIPPIATQEAFQKHVLGPLSRGGPDFSKPLRTYLEAYCLRRSEHCLGLPPSREERVTLRLSLQERRLYDKVLDDKKREIDSSVSKGGTIKSNMLFTAMLRMRRLCNAGTFSTDECGVDISPREQPQFRTDCERCSSPGEDWFVLLNSCSVCPDCDRLLETPSAFRYSLDEGKRGRESSLDDVAMHMDDTGEESPDASSPAGGFSTKLSAVVQNIWRLGSEGKNIVFSTWVATLDLLSQLLTEAGIPHLRIDGRVSHKDRAKHLTAFKEDPQILVLLMSIGTGAVGLNLAVANRVHLIEPQWNPSVEAQAIARALRMGQTREVIVIRYVMEKTVEQNILNLQEKKKRLAKFTFDRGSDDGDSGIIEDLKSVLDITST
ncbi:Fc.00g001720.m01.CDS01 [Cosmosporella sp. VM-42]